ncbi:MAG: AAA family ATPase [Chloroflexota bacterium]
MLTEHMQIQAIADRLTGLNFQANTKDFKFPWQQIWQAIIIAKPGEERDALVQVISQLPNGQDILQKILAANPGYRPPMPSFAEISKYLPPIEWVWDGWIPRGLLTVLGASQGSGKSFVSMDLAHRIIHGKDFPDSSAVKRPGANIIYLDAENVPQILNERTQNYGTDQSKLFLMHPDAGEMIDLGKTKDRDRLSDMAHLLRPELIIVDSLSTIHSGGQNDIEDVRSLIGYLTQLVSSADCGLLLVHHIRKPAGGGQRMMNVDLGMEDLSGSSFITQAARVVIGLHVVQTGNEFDPNGPRAFKMLKNNLGRYPEPLGFSFEPLHPKGVWLKWNTTAPQSYRKPTQVDECISWLTDLLKSNLDGMKPKDVILLGKTSLFTRDTIYRTRNALDTNIQDTHPQNSPLNCWKWSDSSATTLKPD